MHCKTTHVMLSLCILTWEWWLGRTKKVESNSTIQLITVGAVLVASFIIVKLKGLKYE